MPQLAMLTRTAYAGPPRTSANAAVSDGSPASAPREELSRELQELLRLTAYESKLLLALLQLGTGNSHQLARLSGVPRTSVYDNLGTLCDRGLAERLPAAGSATWASVGREEVLDRLAAAETDEREAERRQFEDRLRDLADRRRRIRAQIEGSLQETPGLALPYVRLVRSRRGVLQTYHDLLARARSELLMYTRPPYATGQSYIDRSVLTMLERGVSARVLYERGYTDRGSFAVYHDAGVRARIVEHLPIKLVVVDREASLISLTDPVLPEAGYPVTMLVEHAGYAEFAAASFERMWESGTAYAPRQIAGKASQANRTLTSSGAPHGERRRRKP